MLLWLLIGSAAALLLAGLMMHRRDLRAVAEIHIPEKGEPCVKFTPGNASGEELVRLAITYGSKLRWILLGEFTGLQESFRDLTAEMVDALALTGRSLLGSMPSVQPLLQDPDRPRAAPGGERYVIRYYRTRYRTFRNTSSLWNSLPRPGLAANLVWNYCLLWDAIGARISEEAMSLAQKALELWWDAAFAAEGEDPTLKGLRRLMMEGDVACEIAFGTDALRKEARG